MSNKNKIVVISQSMYFPWCGLLDQIRLADIFIHYDDVQLSRGFYNRVQVKTETGTSLLTVPLTNKKQKQLINSSLISYNENWIDKHRSILINSYRKLPFIDDAIDIFDSVHSQKHESLHQVSRASIKALADYFQLSKNVSFIDSVELGVGGSSTRRLVNLTKEVGGRTYLTGHGALKYLDHNLFERNGIEVRYMEYNLTKYAQIYGAFTPYVTALDAVAHLGANARHHLTSTSKHWRDTVG